MSTSSVTCVRFDLTPPGVSENMVRYMRLPVLTLSLILLAGCAARRPAYVVVPRANCRSEEPVTLPLTPEGRQRLEAFLGHGGHPQAPDPVPDPQPPSIAACSTLSKTRSIST